MIDKDAVLDFNGHMHRLAAVVSSAKTTNFKTKVAVKDLHDVAKQPRASSRVWPAGLEIPVDTITVLYKYEGKFVLLTNSHKVNLAEDSDVVGYVISSVALKSCRFPDHQIPLTVPEKVLDERNNERTRVGITDWLKHVGTTPAQPTRPAQATPDEFRNQPRWNNKPVRRQYG